MPTREHADVVTGRGHPSLRMRFVCAWLAATRTKRILGDDESTEADRRRNRRRGPAAVPRRLRRTHDVTVHDRAGLRSGKVNINEGYAAAWGSTDAPMGGWGASGQGSRHGRHGLLKYTDAQTVARQRGQSLGKPAGVGGERYARAMTVAMRVLDRLAGKG
ncbi:aldehyde dehydrogenase family protein [Streptomyces sp. NPDC048291]|uniref:aldehyde dehydrogenase family protein n=1 Tax=Streptomyces sp. NPDC048291 TaxID=3365530 RepID=UPI00371CF7B8